MNSFQIAKNIIKRLLKEISAVGFIVIFPILAAVLSSVIFGEGSKLTIGIANAPGKDYPLVQYITTLGKYNVSFLDSEEIKNSVDNKKINAGLIFPEDFHKKLLSGQKDKIKLISRKNEAEVQELRGHVEGYLGRFLSGAAVPEEERVKQEIKSFEKPRAAIGMLCMFILMFTGTGMGLLLEDKKNKTFMRIFCAPVKEREMVLGHLLANILLGALQIVIFLLVTVFLFKMDLGTSPLNIFVILMLYLIASVGFTIGLVSLIGDGQKYNLILTLIAIVSSFVSGAFIPEDLFSSTMKKAAAVMPQKWVLDAFSSLIKEGSLAAAKNSLLILILFGAVFFVLGINVLKPTAQDI